MLQLSEEKFNELRQDAKVLEKDKFGDKVLLTRDRKICKIFRCKRALSTAQFYPYAQRFADNAKKLKELGFISVDVELVSRVKEISRDVIVYPLLEGETLRQVLADNPEKVEHYIAQLVDYIVSLHNRGVYFRSLHFGNVLVLTDDSFGLIDVSDMKIYSSSISLSKRVRNFKAVLRYEEDILALKIFGVKNFLDRYCQEASMDTKKFYKKLLTTSKHPAIELLKEE